MKENLTGNKYGKLTVLDLDESRTTFGGKGRTYWICKCDCGTVKSIRSDSLKNGSIVSCGCYCRKVVSERMKKEKTKHNGRRTKLYYIWCTMKNRCFNENNASYVNYGARGIFVCDEWKNDFSVFRSWAMQNGYVDGLSIDRIDNNKGYSPENCRWVTRDVQANNRRSNVLLTYNGETHNITEWASILNIPPKRLFSRRYAGHDAEHILKI